MTRPSLFAGLHKRLFDRDYSPAHQDEYQRLWHADAKLRRCNAPMPCAAKTAGMAACPACEIPCEAFLCDLWPGHEGPHINAAQSAEWGPNAGKINAR